MAPGTSPARLRRRFDDAFWRLSDRFQPVDLFVPQFRQHADRLVLGRRVAWILSKGIQPVNAANYTCKFALKRRGHSHSLAVAIRSREAEKIFCEWIFNRGFNHPAHRGGGCHLFRRRHSPAAGAKVAFGSRYFSIAGSRRLNGRGTEPVWLAVHFVRSRGPSVLFRHFLDGPHHFGIWGGSAFWPGRSGGGLLDRFLHTRIALVYICHQRNGNSNFRPVARDAAAAGGGDSGGLGGVGFEGRFAGSRSVLRAPDGRLPRL